MSNDILDIFQHCEMIKSGKDKLAIILPNSWFLYHSGTPPLPRPIEPIPKLMQLTCFPSRTPTLVTMRT